MTTVIDERVGVTWEEITDTDEPEACLFVRCGRRAVAAFYLPQCGRHPTCRRCLTAFLAYIKATIRGPVPGTTITVTCYMHCTERSYTRDPFVIEGSSR